MHDPTTPRLRRLIFGATLIATFVAACLPPAEAPTLGESDKFNHIVAFTVLSIVASWAYPRLRAGWILVGLGFVGGAIELVQAIPAIGRDAEWADWAADLAAVAITLAIVAALRWFARQPAGLVKPRR